MSETTATQDRPSAEADLDRLLVRLRQLMPEPGRRYHVRSLAVFGSYARGEQTPESDLDLLFEFEQVPSLLTLVGMENALSDELGIKVDLVLRRALKPRIGERVNREALPV